MAIPPFPSLKGFDLHSYCCLPHYVFRPKSPAIARFHLLLSGLRHSLERSAFFDIFVVLAAVFRPSGTPKSSQIARDRLKSPFAALGQICRPVRTDLPSWSGTRPDREDCSRLNWSCMVTPECQTTSLTATYTKVRLRPGGVSGPCRVAPGGPEALLLHSGAALLP